MSQWMPATLRGRLVLTYALLAIALTAAIGYLLLRWNDSNYEDDVGSLLQNQAQMVTGAFTGTASYQEQVDAMSSANTNLAVVDPSGSVVATSSNDALSIPAALLQEQDGAGYAQSGVNWFAMAPLDNSVDRLVTVTPASMLPAEGSESGRQLLLLAALAAGLAGASSALIAHRIASPLEQLRLQAERVASGDLSVRAVPNPPDEIAAVARAFNAMTERVQELLQDQEATQSRLELIFANLTDGVIVLDQEGCVVTANPKARYLLQADESREAGQPIVVYARDHDLAGLVEKALNTGSLATTTVDHSTSRRTLEAVAMRVISDEEPIAVLLLRDITDMRRLEAVRREFVANVSHELKSPLSSIRALVETLDAGAIDDPQVAHDFMQRVIGEVDRLTGLVDELLDLGRLESGRVQLNLAQLDVRELLERSLRRMRPQIERSQLIVNVDIGDGLPVVWADAIRIDQVLINLLRNAIKFTPTGGSITLTAERTGNLVRIAVRDTGAGILPDEIERVFERFYKSDKARASEGSGLGLAIAKHIVTAHNGQISVVSDYGNGAEFWFTLPLAAEPLAPNGDSNADRARPVVHHRAR